MTTESYLEALRSRVQARLQLAPTRCGVCERELTDPRSIEAGMGPVCHRNTDSMARESSLQNLPSPSEESIMENEDPEQFLEKQKGA